MSLDEPPNAWESLPTNTCRVCGIEVPVGEFCGRCGASRFHRRGSGPDWLRGSAYAAASGEPVLRPAFTSTVFPGLPPRSRMAFGAATIGLVLLLTVIAALRWQAPLIGLVAVGLPMLFGGYLIERDAFADLSAGTLAITAVLSVTLGIGWALGTDAAVVRTEDDALGLPVSVARILVTGLGIPLGFVILLVAPVVLVRVWRPGVRESLDGFVIAALAGYCFTAAGTMARLAPQFADGPAPDDSRTASDLMIAATIGGLAIPLTAAALAGALGATLWFTRRMDSPHPSRWYALTSPVPSAGFALAVYLGLGLLDFTAVASIVEMCVYGLLAVLALYALRLVLHATLLGEAPDDASPDEPVLCPQCDHVVPDLPFCPSCGVAGHAASRTSRTVRRANRPVPAGTAPDPA